MGMTVMLNTSGTWRGPVLVPMVSPNAAPSRAQVRLD